MSYLQAPVCEYLSRRELFMLPYYKRRKSDRAFEQYFAVRMRTKNCSTLALPSRLLFYLAVCVEFPAAVVVVGAVAEPLVDPSASAVPAC